MKTENYKRKIRNIFFIFSISILVSSVLLIFLTGVGKFAFRTDLVTFITGARIIRGGEGEKIYDLKTQTKYQDLITSPYKLKNLLPFRNPPILAFIFIPLSLVPISTAYNIYALMQILIILIIIWISKKSLRCTRNIFWVFLPFLYAPSLIAIYNGQISLLLLFLFVLAFYLFRKDKYFWAGVIASLLIIKPQYIIVSPFLLIISKDRAGFLKGFLSTVIILYLGSTILSGAGFLKDYVQMIIETENPMYALSSKIMFTLYYSLEQITSFSRNNLFLFNLTLYLLSIWFYYINYKKFSLEINFSVAIILMLVFCVHGANNDLAILLLPLWLLIENLRENDKANIGNAIVIFVMILYPLVYILNTPYLVPFLFLLSVALLFKKINLQSIYK